jgi:hypothetical protein
MFPPGVLQAGLAGDAVGDEGAVLCEPGREAEGVTRFERIEQIFWADAGKGRTYSRADSVRREAFVPQTVI